MKRLTVHFSGLVQGVGFRYTTRQVAAKHDVTGYVKNLPDGRVELVAEGDADELARFTTAVKQAMGTCIRDAQTAESPATSEYASFDVAF